MLDTVDLENGTRAGMYGKEKEVLSSKNIPINSKISVASDKCARKMGKSNNFKARRSVLKDLPSLLMLGCAAQHRNLGN